MGVIFGDFGAAGDGVGVAVATETKKNYGII